MTAHDLRTKRRLVQQTPNFPAVIRLFGDKVVISHVPIDEHYSVYVWDLSLNHVQRIGSFSNLRLCHVNATDNVLVAFEINWKKQPAEVRQTKCATTNGQLLEKKTFHLLMQADLPIFDPIYLARNLYRTYGHKTISNILFENNQDFSLQLEYDYAVDRFSVRQIHCAEPVTGEVRYNGTSYVTSDLVYRFHTKAAQIVIYNAATGKATLHPTSDVIRLQVSTSWILQQLREKPSHSFWPGRVYLFGDREVFGLANRTGVHLWFFNPSFASELIHDEELSFSKGRTTGEFIREHICQ